MGECYRHADKGTSYPAFITTVQPGREVYVFQAMTRKYEWVEVLYFCTDLRVNFFYLTKFLAIYSPNLTKFGCNVQRAQVLEYIYWYAQHSLFSFAATAFAWLPLYTWIYMERLDFVLMLYGSDYCTLRGPTCYTKR